MDLFVKIANGSQMSTISTLRSSAVNSLLKNINLTCLTGLRIHLFIFSVLQTEILICFKNELTFDLVLMLSTVKESIRKCKESEKF